MCVNAKHVMCVLVYIHARVHACVHMRDYGQICICACSLLACAYALAYGRGRNKAPGYSS